MATKIAEDVSHADRKHLQWATRTILGILAKESRSFEKAAPQPTLHQHQPFALVREQGRMPDVGVGRKVFIDFCIRKVTR